MKVFDRTLIEKFFRKSSQKPNFVHRSDHPHMGLFPTKKTELTPIEKTPNPGILWALFSVSLQYGLRLCENDPLFDRKLLEYLHEQGVRITSDNAIIRVGPQFQKIHYSEPNAGSDWHFSDPVFGFLDDGVHR